MAKIKTIAANIALPFLLGAIGWVGAVVAAGIFHVTAFWSIEPSSKFMHGASIFAGAAFTAFWLFGVVQGIEKIVKSSSKDQDHG